MKEKYIYHIATPQWWTKFEDQESYESETLKEEGFIHCSTLPQLLPTCDRHFQGHAVLIILQLETELLESKLLYELAPSVDQEFPHIFGPINQNAIIDVQPIQRNAEGYFSLPEFLDTE